jgi:hypothetical protein
MRKTLFISIVFLATILVSCSSNSDRLITAFTAEIGNSPTIKAYGNSKISYTWSSVSMVKKDILKSIADKELKMNPTSIRDLGSALDENQNPIMGKIQQSWIYETSQNKTELTYQLSNSTIDVILTVTKK